MPDNFPHVLSNSCWKSVWLNLKMWWLRAGGEVYSAVNGLWNHQWSQGKGKEAGSYGAWSLLSVRMMYPKKLRELEVGNCAPGTRNDYQRRIKMVSSVCLLWLYNFFPRAFSRHSQETHLHMQRSDTYSYYCYHCSMNIYDYVIVKYIFESETYETLLCYYLTYCVESDINWFLFPFSSDDKFACFVL